MLKKWVLKSLIKTSATEYNNDISILKNWILKSLTKTSSAEYVIISVC